MPSKPDEELLQEMVQIYKEVGLEVDIVEKRKELIPDQADFEQYLSSYQSDLRRSIELLKRSK